MLKLTLPEMLLWAVILAGATSQADMIPSQLGHQGPRLAPGVTPSKLGWGADGQAYRDRFVVTPADGAEMVWVPAGEFTMGSPEGEGLDDEHPQHQVVLSGYWMDRTEVTNEQYGKFLAWIKQTGDHSKCFKGEPAEPPDRGHKDHTPRFWTDARWNGPHQPVSGVDWFDAYAYAAWAGKRLPTEAQWEKAARGTDSRKYPWGNDWDVAKCNSDASHKNVTVAVGSYPAGQSPYGCLDMAGNVEEWCADWYGGSYYQSSPRDNPTGPSGGGRRLQRGGSWYDVPVGCRTAVRVSGWYIPIFRAGYAGFRCVLTP